MATPVAAQPVDRSAVELIEAIIRDAEFMADLTGNFLDHLGFLPPLKQRRQQPVALPREFLLELAAILRIALWEQAGLRDRLGHDLPPAEHALADLFARFAQGTSEARSEEAPAGIVMEVFKITLSRLAWGGRRELNVDVVLDQPDDEILLEALADLLWAHRHAGTLRG